MTSRGNEKKPVFKYDTDRDVFLNTMQHVNKRYNWICHAYCLMTNHYHLLVETPDGNLAIGMRQINSVYTQLFNKRHGRTGHLFQGRYKAIVIQKDSHLIEVCRYVVLNPVRAKMVESPEEWKWSSYLATAGKGKPHPCLTTDWVLGQFSGKQGTAEREYRKFVQWGIGQPTIWTEVRGQSLLGEESFMDKLVDHLKKYKDVPEIPRGQRYATRPTLKVLLPDGIGDDPKKLKKRLSEAVEKHGYRQSEIARHIGMHYSTISRWLREHENARRKT